MSADDQIFTSILSQISQTPQKKRIFDEQISRKPDNYPWTKDFMDAIWHGFWTADEFNFISDYSQFYNDLTEQQRGIVVRTLSAIGQIEVAVKTFWAKLGDTLPHPSVRDLGYAMANNEVIHNFAYEKLLTVLGLEDAFDATLDEPVIKGRVDYLRKYLKKIYQDDKKQFVYALALFTLFVENVSLFSQFYIIKHLNKDGGLLKDTAQQVMYTMQEEELHSQVGIKLINTIREEYPELFDAELEARIIQECKEAITHEVNVIKWILGDYEKEGLNVDILTAFITKRMADAMDQIGVNHGLTYIKKDYNQAKWFDVASRGVNLVDFFASRPVDYAKGKGVDVEDLF